MKKLLFIAALLVTAFCAKAQTNETTYLVDTLSYLQLRAEIVTMNNQIIKFRENELVAVGLGAGSAAFSIAGISMSAKGMEGAQAMYICAGVTAITSLVWYVSGYVGLKRDRLEVTPNGMVIKFRDKKKPYRQY